MKTIVQSLFVTLALLAGLLQTAAQGTAFTYQGQLISGGGPAGGAYHLTFSLFNTNSGGAAIAGPFTTNAVWVTNGLFTVQIDFGPGVFTGASNWLQIGVATNGASGFTTLSPRQPLTPTPYAIFAGTAANLSGTLPLAQLPGVVITNNESATTLGNVTLSGQLTLPAIATIDSGGNALLYSDENNNLFLGVDAGNSATSGSYNTAVGVEALNSNTTGFGNAALGTSALRNNTGGAANTAIGENALYHNTNGFYNTAIGAGALFYNNAAYDTAIGVNALYDNTSGTYNTASGAFALYNNTNGWFDTANGTYALFSNPNGSYNTANGAYALFGNTNGSYNTANGAYALGNNTNGSDNTASGAYALANNTNGSGNTANGAYALGNTTNGSANIALGYNAGYNFTGNESSNIDIGNPGVKGENNVIRIGAGQTQTWLAGTVNGDGGGLTNLTAVAAKLTVGPNENFFVGPAGNLGASGLFNTAIGLGALTSDNAGTYNTAISYDALTFNVSGSFNTALGNGALLDNVVGSYNTAVGYFALRYLGYNYIGGSNNIALGYGAATNLMDNESGNIDIGSPGVRGDYNTIRIGASQTQTWLAGVINGNGGGLTNLGLADITGALPSGTTFTVAGNQSGGFPNPLMLVNNANTGADASPALRVIGNGYQPDGVLSVSSQGTGLIAEFGNANAFVSRLDTNGNWTATTFNPSSDRNIKANFTPVSPRDILARVAALPISRWNFTNAPAIPHLGPMAQDFYQAFNVGMDDKHIATVDEDGVALAAIQGLNQKLNEKDAEIQDLKTRMDKLEQILETKNSGGK